MGKTGKEIEELTGVRQNCASEIWTAYQREGESSLKRKQYGRKAGTHMVLTLEEQEDIRQTIAEKVPEDFGIVGKLWTLGRTRAYIQKQHHKAINTRTLAENVVIYWGDEAGISNCEIVEDGFSTKGRPPVLPVEIKRQRVNMISAISDQGRVRFMVYLETMDQQRMIRFMGCLIRTSKQKVFLILDNLRVHHGKLVSA